MKRLEFHISYICSHNCIFCSEYDRMNKFKNYPVSLNEIKIVLVDRRKKGFNHINFTGGEPSLVPNFLEILKFAKKLGYKIYVGTNGTMLSSEAFTQKMLEFVDELSLSVHWYDQKSCEKQTGSKLHYSNYAGIIANVNKYKKNNEFFLNIVINKYNYKEIIKIIKFNLDTGYDFNQVLISFIAPEGSAEHNYKDLAFDLNLLKKDFPEMIKLCNDLGKKIRFFGIPNCILGEEFVEYSNDLHWEERHTIERYKNSKGKITLIDVYSKDNSRERCFVKKCKDCIWYKKPCTGVFGKYLDYYEL